MQGKAIPTKVPIRTLSVLFLVGLCIALIFVFFPPGKVKTSNSVTLKDLKGVWTTIHPDYRDRYLEFADETIIFGWGGSGNGAYSVETIECEQNDQRTLVRIQYSDLAAIDYQLSFFYLDQRGGIIRMRHQEEIDWFRTSDQPTHMPQFK